MARVAATAPDPSMPGFPLMFTLLEAGANMNPQARLKILSTLLLGVRPPLALCL